MAQEYIDTQTGEMITAADLESKALTQAQESNPTVTAANPLDLPVEVFSAALERRKANRTALMQWVRAALVEGVDFGKIHVVSRSKCNKGKFCQDPSHFSKPSLFKPGAEKITGMLGVIAHFPTLGEYEQAVLEGRTLQQVILRCELHDASGRVVADGVGARSLAQDNGDLNKALKMAEKAGMIDATLRMAGLSEVFTQDIEDMAFTRAIVEQQQGKQTKPQQSNNRNVVDIQDGRAKDTDKPQSGSSQDVISAARLRTLEKTIQDSYLDPDRVVSWVRKAWGVQSLAQLNNAQFRRLMMEKLIEFKEQLKDEVISDCEVTAIREFVHEKGLDLDGFELWAGCSVCDITNKDLKQVWGYLGVLANRKEYEALTEEQRQARRPKPLPNARSETFGT